MKNIAIAIDKWKLPIFKKHLEKAGYTFETNKGLTESMWILNVESKTVAIITPVIEAAQKEAAKHKRRKMN